MSVTEDTTLATDLRGLAQQHLWMHYTRLADSASIPIIVRGDGCYVWDSNGKRYLDGLSGLFCVQLGYSFGEEIGIAAAAQLKELPYFSNWSHAHPRSIELAAQLADLAPPGLDRCFFVSGGSEAVESAWKLARQYFQETGERRWKGVARNLAWHGTTGGALALNGLVAARTMFEPLVGDVIHVSNTNRFRRPAEETEQEFTSYLLDEMERMIEVNGPDTIAMVILEPVQNVGGSLLPPEGYFKGVRELCDRYGILLCADEVITGFGRVGRWFASEKYDIAPDLITCAKGLSSGHAAIGAVIASDRLSEPFKVAENPFMHGITYGGHPVNAAIALKNLEIMKREKILDHVNDKATSFRGRLDELLALPLVGDVRGEGFFYAVELVSDPDTNGSFTDQESQLIVKQFISTQLYERGLICRTDDRADPVLMISPPLVAEEQQFDEIVGVIGSVLEDAWPRLQEFRESSAARNADASAEGQA
jgi:adenosylmethionine-8-amino-7-oxononanoate aminotransferase